MNAHLAKLPRRLRNVVARLVLLLIAAGIVACGEESQRGFQPLAPQALVLAFGDSLTFGTGASPGESYPHQLASLIKRRVVRAGVPGEISAQGRERLPGLLKRHRPQLLLLLHGGNDILRRMDRQAMKKNLKAMIEMARAQGTQVALIGVPAPRPALNGSAAIYAELARELEVPFEGDAVAEVLSDRKLKNDLIHPNARGYRVLAEAIAKFLKDRGAL